MNTSTTHTSMISELLNLKLKTQLTILISFMLVGFVIAGVLGDRAFSKVLVNGPVYQDIISNKDLAADILPPQAYLLESWQVALELASLKNQPLQPMLDKSNQLAQDFTTRVKYWSDTIKNPKVHDLFTKDLQETGEEFLRVREEELIPAIKSGDAKRISDALEN